MPLIFEPAYSGTNVEAICRAEGGLATAASVDSVLAVLHAAARISSSLVASRQSIERMEAPFEISKFLLLGQRGGGRPIRLGLFAEYEADCLDPVCALARVLLLLNESRSQTRDYAFIGYPISRSLTSAGQYVSAEFTDRISRKKSADLVWKYFQTELQKWRFDGVIAFRGDACARDFYATVNSELVAAEVVEPAFAIVAANLPLVTRAVKGRSSDRSTQTMANVTSRSKSRPSYFEITIHFPRKPITEAHLDGLFVALTEILRLYRAFIAHGQDL